MYHAKLVWVMIKILVYVRLVLISVEAAPIRAVVVQILVVIL